ncbi:MAG: cobalamin-dependent protein, partial [Alphaproteobacteria bacterium]|nr:cobalamin-dependent protein [Alphaproteobacteria bacterium]
GVNKSTLEEPPLEILEIDASRVREDQIKRLEHIKKERDGKKVEQILKKLTQAAKEGTNVMPLALEAMRVRATIGEVSSALEEVFTRYEAPMRTIHGVYGALYEAGRAEEVATFHERMEAFEKRVGKKPHMMVAKLGQDGHDRGAKIIASAFEDLGFQVDVGPLFQTPEEAVKVAVQKKVHVLGLSSQAAGHHVLVPQVLKALISAGGQDILVVCGGVIPPQDYEGLYAQGVAAIFGPGTSLLKAAESILTLLEKSYKIP